MGDLYDWNVQGGDGLRVPIDDANPIVQKIHERHRRMDGQAASVSDLQHVWHRLAFEGYQSVEAATADWVPAPTPGPLPDVRQWNGNHFANTGARAEWQFMFTIGAWPERVQDEALRQYRADGYTHLTLTPWMRLRRWQNGSGGRVDYPAGFVRQYDWRGDLRPFVDLCLKVEAAGIVPCVCLNHKSLPANGELGVGPLVAVTTFDAWQRLVESLLAFYVPMVIKLGWESNTTEGFMGNESDHLDIYRWLRTVFDGVILDHWSPGRDAATNRYDPNRWRREAVVAGLTGVLFQEYYKVPVEDMLFDMYHLPAPRELADGICGRCETISRDGAPGDLDFIAYECRRDLDGYQRLVAGIPEGRRHHGFG